MPFDDLAAFFDPTLRLPIRGTTYEVPPPDYATGLRLEAMAALLQGHATAQDRERLRLDDDAQRDLFGDCLGPAFRRMLDDGLPWPLIRAAGVTAYVWITQDKCKGTTYAEQQWARAGEPPGEAVTPSQDPDTATATPTTPSTRTAAASGTRRRGRGSGTSTSRRTPSPQRKADTFPAGPTS